MRSIQSAIGKTSRCQVLVPTPWASSESRALTGREKTTQWQQEAQEGTAVVIPHRADGSASRGLDSATTQSCSDPVSPCLCTTQDYLKKFYSDLEAAHSSCDFTDEALYEEKLERLEASGLNYNHYLPPDVLEAGLQSGRYVEVRAAMKRQQLFPSPPGGLRLQTRWEQASQDSGRAHSLGPVSLDVGCPVGGHSGVMPFHCVVS